MSSGWVRLEQPDVYEEHGDGEEEKQPPLPADAAALGHDEHAVHGAAEAHARRVKGVVHLLGEGGRFADFVADGSRHVFEDPDFAQNARNLLVVLTLQLVQNRVAVLPLLVRRRSSVRVGGRPGVAVAIAH